ncbi:MULTISPECIES: phage holin family protein [unclassified Acidovorax]|uniref:phage holin family protein n=1 Tax=unclassified Acidovorax TaxID=2684926 RepID=UPI0023491574|nr:MULTISPECIES: phage holin family protein [unclassified Acidovorax]WCM99910.1 phage holin family protein [Acidovorax sp. GBBC 1281]GKS96392.1 phage holin family protein [Acidovorax sp. SUPP2825]GKT14664.1 phage holin family protein [Acidovorax sp. SUPP2522]
MNWLALLGLDGWVARWRAAVIEGAIAAEDRLDLVRLEWAEQKRRLGLMVMLVVAVGGLTVVTLVLASLAVLVQFWDSPQRTMVGWLVAGTWLVLWAGALIGLISVAKQAGNAFALTRQELAQDWRDIKERL